MGRDTKIEWTATYLPDGTVLPGFTLNFWWGCQKVSPGCQRCYAETFSKRVGREIWGPAKTTERWRTKSPWVDCLKWDKQAKADGVRRKVFVLSMGDFFEDHPQVEPWREEAFKILEGFEWLDVQLLTKRPENILRMVPDHWLKSWPGHIWMGTTTENQEYYNRRLEYLLKVPAKIHFLSLEPLLGPIDLRWCNWCGRFGDHDCEGGYPWAETDEQDQTGVNWVITGGESGHSARPCHPDWVRSLRDQCQAANVPYFHKQWGEWAPTAAPRQDYTGDRVLLSSSGEIKRKASWADVMTASGEWYGFEKVGKAAAGCLLDGIEYKQFPRVG